MAVEYVAPLHLIGQLVSLDALIGTCFMLGLVLGILLHAHITPICVLHVLLEPHAHLVLWHLVVIYSSQESKPTYITPHKWPYVAVTKDMKKFLQHVHLFLWTCQR